MQPDSNVIRGYDGILFIGDLHLSSTRLGRRLDDYTEAGLDKLRQCVQIARERNLLPVCLGDLYHRPRDNSLVLLSRLTTVLGEFRAPAIGSAVGAPKREEMLLLAGSHDRTESWFTERDADYLLAQNGVLKLIEQPGLVLTLEIGGKLVNLWATPAGCRVPSSVPAEPNTHNIMVTHHDFDFQGMYPGAEELREIKNCDMLVNGHMHTQAPMVFRGGMACHNPGSVMRNTVDLKKQKPVVSVWTPAHGVSLEPVPLVVAANVFDLTGTEVYAADPRDLKASLPKGLSLSSFASKIRATESLEAARTGDGSVVSEEMQEYFQMFDKPDNLRRYMTGLLNTAIEARVEAAAAAR
jgi:Calcineurin-like phosphoesterase